MYDFLKMWVFKVLQGQINSNKFSSKHGKMGYKSLYPLKQKYIFKAEEVENSIIKLKKSEMKLNL